MKTKVRAILKGKKTCMIWTKYKYTYCAVLENSQDRWPPSGNTRNETNIPQANKNNVEDKEKQN
jgi:hypothetical protein